MHVFIEEELMRVSGTSKSESAASGSRSRQDRLKRKQSATVVEWEEEWRRAMVRSFLRMDEVALTTCACGNLGNGCVCPSLELALGGSTAVVVVLTACHIIVANCGDSRAVLCRGGRAVLLSHNQMVSCQILIKIKFKAIHMTFRTVCYDIISRGKLANQNLGLYIFAL